MANKPKKKPAPKKMQDPNTVATNAAQRLLDTSAVLVKSIKGGENPTHLEVYGLAGIILKDVYEELMKEMTDGNTDTGSDTSADRKAATPAPQS